METIRPHSSKGVAGMRDVCPKRLRYYMEQKGYSQADLERKLYAKAQETSMKPSPSSLASSISKWLRGKNTPGSGYLGLLAQVLETSIDNLYDEQETVQ